MGLADHDPPSPTPADPAGPVGASSAAPPRRRAGSVVTVTLAIVVVIAGGIAAAVLGHRPSDRAGAGSRSEPSETPFAGGYTGDLRQLLLARPSTARPTKDPISDDGVLSVDQAAQITHPVDEAKAQLVAFGYQRGAVAQWQDGDTEVIIRLFQFASPRNAQGYQDALDETFAPGFFDQAAAPVELPGGHIYVSTRPLDERGFLGSATAVRSNLLMIVTRYQPTSLVGPIVDLATSQYTHLPA